MRKIFIIPILVFVLLLAGCTINTTAPANFNDNGNIDVSNLKADLEKQVAIGKAMEVYQAAKEKGEDLSQGPCLSNELYGNSKYPETMWVLDIAHSPQQAVDDLPQNQCGAFREGKAKHFVELDPDGEVIRAE
jgi:hypothetical protein